MKIKEYIQQIKESKDGRTLVANFGYLSLLQIASCLFPLITMPYLARVIGIDGFGKIAFATAIISWLQTVVDWGFNYTATRDVAKCRDDKEKVSDIFSNVLWSRCLLMLISFIVLAILVCAVPKFRENATIIFVTFLFIPGYIMFPEWFFQALERMQYITILNVSIRLFFTIAIFFFIKSADDYVLQPLLIALGYFISGIMAMYFILHKWQYRLQRPTLKKITATIKRSTNVFINNLMPNLYNSFSKIVLGIFCNVSANGLLDASDKFITLFHKFVQVTSRIFFPYLSRHPEKFNLYKKIDITCSFFVSVLLLACAPLLIKLFFTPEFYDSIVVLQIMSFSILFITLSSVYGTNYMILRGYENQLRNITLIYSIFGFIMSVPLIHFWGYIGAAINITLTRALIGITEMLFAHHKEKQVE